MANYGYDDILKRLTIILTRLNNGEALSVISLAEELNVNERTIQRDFNEHLKDSLPIYQDNKAWKMKDSFKNSSSAEEAAAFILMEKLMKSAGEIFAHQAKKLLDKNYNTINAFYVKSDTANIGGETDEVIKITGYPAFEKIIDTNDRILESKDEIKSYFADMLVAHMLHIHSSKTVLGALSIDGKYIVFPNGSKNPYQYDSVDELVHAGWRISKTYK